MNNSMLYSDRNNPVERGKLSMQERGKAHCDNVLE